MKKMLALLLAACMLLLCACSSGGASDDPATDPALSVPANTPTETDGTVSPTATEPATEPAPAETEEAPVDPAPTEDEEGIFQADLFALGTVTGDVYENTTLGYGCKLDGWTFADADRIAQINGALSAFVPETAKELIKNSGTFIDMYAESPDALSNVNVNFQSTSAFAGTGFSLEQLIDASIPMIRSQLESANMYSNLSVEKETAQFAGESVPIISIAGTVQGINIYQKEVVVLCGDYVAYITISTFMTDGTGSILDCFYSLS